MNIFQRKLSNIDAKPAEIQLPFSKNNSNLKSAFDGYAVSNEDLNNTRGGGAGVSEEFGQFFKNSGSSVGRLVPQF